MLFIVQVKSHFEVTQLGNIFLENFESLRTMCETKLKLDFLLTLVNITLLT